MSNPSVTDMVAGASGPTRDFGPINRTDIVRYAGAAGDFNPLHHDDEFAIAAGFPSVFSIGMLHAGYLATYVTDWLGTEGLRRFTARFREQVWLGDVLTCSGRITNIHPAESGEVVVDVELLCVKQTGAQAVTAFASFVRPADATSSTQSVAV